ncbi:MAG: hypothetical protein F4Z65_05435 [Acidobacteria bacterium]|nr:hypothetical protein [Acidobacteriota bacterium]MYA45655.1 hypothetical protein [Acidobacteriota bacterium]MYI37943.1 hypothetical protein [Acidobacteriota bacterium]
MQKTPRLDRYFQHTKTWRAEKQRLRAILLDFPLTEELKWRQPCYVFEGSNVVIVGGFKQTVDLGFFKGALLDNPHGLLVPPGPHSQASRQLRFTSVGEIEEKEPIIRATLQNAIEVERAGLKVDFRQKHDLVPVAELLAKIESDPEFQAAFEALTPGRQRGYNLFFGAAKQSKTRAARIEKHAARILEGKGMHDR